MRLPKMFSFLPAVFCFAQQATAQKPSRITASDLRPLIGCFEGKLTYLDYKSGKPFTMPANLNISQPLPRQFIFSNIYPDEPNANSFDTLQLSADGRMLNDEKVIAKRKNKSGVEIITQSTGTDGNDKRPSTFRFTYMISPQIYSVKKEVKFKGESVWLTRHEYNYKARPCR